MPLTFDARQLLPEGIHEATVDEVERELSLSNRRRTLIDNLKQYIADLRVTGWACHLLVDGSFVMPSVLEPNDIDVILVLPADWDMTRTDFKAYEYKVLDKRHTRLIYKIEVYAVLPNSTRHREFLELFTQVRVEWCQRFGWAVDTRKGIVRIVP